MRLKSAPARIVRHYLRSDLTSGEAIKLVLDLEDMGMKERTAGCKVEVRTMEPLEEGKGRRLIQWRMRTLRQVE